MRGGAAAPNAASRRNDRRGSVAGRCWRALCPALGLSLGRLLGPLLGLLFAAGVVVAAQPDKVDQDLAEARQQIDRLQKQVADGATLESLLRLRSQAIGLQSRSAAVADALAPQVANVEARLAELGAAPAAGASETPEITAQRRSLADERAQLDAQLRFARLLAIESEQAAEQITMLRRSRFEAQLGERTESILAPPFWRELRESWQQDAPRVRTLARDLAAAARAGAADTWAIAILAAGAALALLPLALRLLLRFVTTRLPAGRVRRSMLALGNALLPAAAVLLAGHALRWGVVDGGAARPAVESLLLGLAGALAFGTYVAALGRALMSPKRPSWRLPEIADPIASRLRHDPLLLGAVITTGWTADRLAALVNASLASAVAINCLFSLALGALLVRTLRRGELVRRQLLAAPQSATAPPRSLGLLAVVVASWSVLAASVACLLLGYVALGSLLVKQVAWVVIVGASAYLLACVAADACTTWLGAATAGGDDATDAGQQQQQRAEPVLRRQAAVLLAAACRLVIAVVALALMLGPLGQAPVELMQRAGGLSDGILIGEIRLLPSAVLQALGVLAIGGIAVRALKAWLLDQYLPTTTLDAGMRTSTATLLGYVGIVFVAALALSALGLGLERVAWVASALSVGIGFGLQAVVQNFVSGLILLTERPVKVGDWVALGGVEGDIRRINVRATEIQTGDRSTVIVPNSEFITKVVRNVTHANPLGLVQIKLPMPLDTDPEQVRSLLLAALDAHADVIANPAPSVQLDGIDAGNLVFSATGSVGTQRQAAGVKSALLFDILARLKTAGLALGRPPTMLLREQAGTSAPAPTPGQDAGS